MRVEMGPVAIQVGRVRYLSGRGLRRALDGIGSRPMVKMEVEVPREAAASDVARCPEHRHADHDVDDVVAARAKGEEPGKREVGELARERPLEGECEGEDEGVSHPGPTRVAPNRVGEGNRPGVLVGGDAVHHPEEECRHEHRPQRETDVGVPKVEC
jgi:hypothetical protein